MSPALHRDDFNLPDLRREAFDRAIGLTIVANVAMGLLADALGTMFDDEDQTSPYTPVLPAASDDPPLRPASASPPPP